MTERPILMNGAMVRATLAGTKTQTRRVVKPQPDFESALELLGGPAEGATVAYDHMFGGIGLKRSAGIAFCQPNIHSPYGQPGERLWVRETFYAYGRWVTRYSDKKRRDEWHFIDMTVECDRAYQYEADSPDVPLAKGRGGALPGWHKRPAIFMPRAAYRIRLQITGVRVERLIDISEADAVAEGIERHTEEGVTYYGPYGAGDARPEKAYADLWESINGAGSWADNPWIWVVAFTRAAP